MSMQPPYGGAEPPGSEGEGPGYAGVQAPPAAPSPPPSYPSAYVPAPPDESGAGLATTGLVFGILTLLLPVIGVALAAARFPRFAGLAVLATVPVGIVGVVLSAFGLGGAPRHRSAIAGLILSILGLVFGLAILGLGLVALNALRMHGMPPIRRRLLP